jgi:hypothetical protein
MTSIQSIEDAIVTLLTALFTTLAYPTVQVGPLPTNKAENTTIVDGQQIWAMVHTIKGGEERSAQSLFQDVTYQVGITVESRQLREDLGTYNLMDLVNKALLGKRPLAGCGWLRLTPGAGWHNKGEENGVFKATGLFECPGLPLVADIDPEEGDDAPLTQSTFNLTVNT